MIRSLSNEDEECQESLNRQAYTQTLGRSISRGSLDSGIYSQTLDRKGRYQTYRSTCSQEQLPFKGKSCSNGQLANRFESKESLNGRSLSLTDLLHGESRSQLRRCTSDTGKKIIFCCHFPCFMSYCNCLQ